MDSNRRTRTVKTLIYHGAAICASAILLGGCATTGSLPQLTGRQSQNTGTSAEIDQYITLSVENGDISVETLFMLVEKYFEEETAGNKSLYAEYEEKRKLYHAGKLKDEPAAPRTDHSGLIKSLRTVKETFGSKPGLDGVLYATGYALYESGAYDESIRTFEELLSAYPQSRFKEEVTFRLGELYFDEGSVIKAADAYSRLTKDRHSVFYDKALYKLGWSRMREGDYAKAFGSFTSVLDHGFEAKGNESEAAIADESFLNAMDALTHMSGKEHIIAAIESVKNAPYAASMTLGTGRLLTEQTRYDESLAVFAFYESAFPDGIDMPLMLLLLSKAKEKSGDTPGAFAAKEKIFSAYGPDSAWYNLRSKDLSTDASDAIAAATYDVAEKYRKTGLDNEDLDSTKKSIEAYKIFLKTFPDHALAKEANINLGEQMFYAENYSDAAKRYEEIMTRWKGTEEGEKGAFSALISYELTAATGKDFDKDDAGSSVERIAAFYSKEFAAGKRKSEFFLKAADILINIGLYAKARNAVIPIKDSDPFPASIKIAESYFRENDLNGAIAFYEAALKIKDDGDVREKLSAIYFMSAESAKDSGHNEETVARYLKSFQLSKKSGHGEDALLNAGRIQLQTGDYTAFDRTMKTIKNTFPYSQGTYLILIEAAKAKESDFDIKAAAAYYKDAAAYASSAGKPADRDRLLLKTADLLSEATEFKAVKTLISGHYKNGDFSSSKEMPFEALSRLAEAELKLGDKHSALKTFSEALKKGSGSASESRVRAALADLKLDEFLAYRIKEPVATTLKKKDSLMKELLTEYAAIAKSQAAEFLPKSFYNMGLIYEDYARALMESPRPKGLTAAELKEYDFLLEEKTYPLEEQAVKSYASALKASAGAFGKSVDSGKWVTLSIERLSELRPVLYKRTLDSVGNTPLFSEPLPIGAK